MNDLERRQLAALWEIREWAHKHTAMLGVGGVADKVWEEIKDRHGFAPDAAQRAASVRVVELVYRYSPHYGPWHGIALKPGQSLAVIERPAAAAAGEGKKP